MNTKDREAIKGLGKIIETNPLEKYKKIAGIEDSNNRTLFQHSNSPFSVAIRFRPSSAIGSNNQEKFNTWDISDTCVYDKLKNTNYLFDHVFDEKSTNQQIFDILVKDVVLLSLSGINVTIFAYGQTSSGKTHTLLGDSKGSYDGIIPLTIREIFSLTSDAENTQNNGTEYTFTVSYLEVYNEKLIDLLVPQHMGNNNEQNLKKIKIVDGVDGNVEFINLNSRRVNSYNDILEIIRIGSKIRHVSETSMNERSSRSHTILRIRIDSKYSDSNDLRVGMLNFVDLAGSESIKRTQLEGERRKEGMSINRSLLAVSQVISQLSEISSSNENNSNNIQRSTGTENNPLPKSKYVNYRDSKITRILSDSLGGNSKTIIVCNCSPDKINYYETVSTLDFAKRAKNIQNKIKVNILKPEEKNLEIFRLKNEIAVLQKKLSNINFINCPIQNPSVERQENDFFSIKPCSKCLFEKRIDFCHKESNIDGNYDHFSFYKDSYLQILTKYAEIIDMKEVTIRNLESDLNLVKPKLIELEKMNEHKHKLINQIRLKNEYILDKNTKIDHLNKILFETRYKLDIIEAQLNAKSKEVSLLKEREHEIKTENNELLSTIHGLRHEMYNFITWYIYYSVNKYNLGQKCTERIQHNAFNDDKYVDILEYVENYFTYIPKISLHSTDIDCYLPDPLKYQLINEELLELKTDIINYDHEKQKIYWEIINSQLYAISNLNDMVINLFEILNLMKNNELLNPCKRQLFGEFEKLSISESFIIRKKLDDIEIEMENANMELMEKRMYETRYTQLIFEMDRLKADNASLTEQLENKCKENKNLMLEINELKYELNNSRSIYPKEPKFITRSPNFVKGQQYMDKNIRKTEYFFDKSAEKENSRELDKPATQVANPAETKIYTDQFSNSSDKFDVDTDNNRRTIKKNEVVSNECNTQ